MQRDELLATYLEMRKVHGELAKLRLAHFATYIDEETETKWFHKLVYDYLDKWIAKDIKKLAIFIPPQHGKSRMSSVVTPAKILGQNPKAKIVVASYSDQNASKFNRSCQDIIDSKSFKDLYPNVYLPAKGIETTNELRNNTFFETVEHKGYFKAVSVQGALTGFSIDYGVIDDPIKDRKQANSKTYRNSLWDWYIDVFKTRLHNDSCQLLLFTRWHEDDMAGRLFDPKNPHYNEQEAKEWTVIAIPALKEEKKPISIALDIPDPRIVGEALWEEKHSKEKYIRRKETNPQSFSSLDQQRPSPAEGNKIKREWFNIIQPSELPFNPAQVKRDFWIDGAFTDKMENDESAQMTTTFYKGNLYIFNANGVRKELNEYLEYIVPYFKEMGYRPTSNVFIELKASGYGFFSMLKQPKYGRRNCVKINSKVVAYGKLNRVENSQPTLASGKVFLVAGGWNAHFIEQCCNFPNDLHDDMLDLLCYAIHHHFIDEDDIDVSYS